MASSPTAKELKQLAASRLAEAKTLRNAGHFSAAWYLAGYAVELALKAVVCKTLGLTEYPEQAFRGSLKSHTPEDLIVLAGLSAALDAKIQDATFDQYWSLVTTWKVQDRYQANRTQQQLDGLLEALEDAQNGVFVWLSNRW